MLNYYQVEGSTANMSLFATTTTASTNDVNWYWHVPSTASEKKTYPGWLQPNDTSGTTTTNMKYCWHCNVYYFGDFHVHIIDGHHHHHDCCCCHHHHDHHNYWDTWIVT